MKRIHFLAIIFISFLFPFTVLADSGVLPLPPNSSETIQTGVSDWNDSIYPRTGVTVYYIPLATPFSTQRILFNHTVPSFYMRGGERWLIPPRKGYYASIRRIIGWKGGHRPHAFGGESFFTNCSNYMQIMANKPSVTMLVKVATAERNQGRCDSY